MSIHVKIQTFCIIFLLLVTSCASQQPLSNYARTGDTILVSLGGTDTNAKVPVLWKENITATVTDATNNAYPVKVRNLFRVYSDPTSKYSHSSSGSSGFLESWVPANMGVWLAVIDLSDPATGQYPPLMTGAGKLSITSPEMEPWIDYSGLGWTWTNGNLETIPIEIIPGTGNPNPLNYMWPVSHYPLDSLEPAPQVEVRANVPAEFGTVIGGATFVFRYVTADFGTTAERRPRVTTTAGDPNVQLASRYVDQGDGTTLLTVLLGNPHGFNPDNSRAGLAQGRSLLRSLRFDIMWRVTDKIINDVNWQSSIQLVSAQFVDLDGNPLPGVMPMMAKVR